MYVRRNLSKLQPFGIFADSLFAVLNFHSLDNNFEVNH